jgi:hypothetical protein
VGARQAARGVEPNRLLTACEVADGGLPSSYRWRMRGAAGRIPYCGPADLRWKGVMSLRPEVVGPVPEKTARVACTAFPKGNISIHRRDVLDVVDDDATLASLFAARGWPAEAL